MKCGEIQDKRPFTATVLANDAVKLTAVAYALDQSSGLLDHMIRMSIARSFGLSNRRPAPSETSARAKSPVYSSMPRCTGTRDEHKRPPQPTSTHVPQSEQGHEGSQLRSQGATTT
jgi:hypothetical protein